MGKHQLYALVGVMAVDGIVVRKADALATYVVQFPGLACLGRGGQLTFNVILGFVGLCIDRKGKQQCGCKQSEMFLHVCLLVIKYALLKRVFFLFIVADVK